MENKLDYTLSTSEERVALVEQLLDTIPPDQINNKLLSYFANYILFTTDKRQTYKERKNEYPIVTNNRETTVNKRQISYEELVGTLESGEDGLHALINNDKHQLLDNKHKISQEELNKYPQLQLMKEQIDILTDAMNAASGSRKYSLKTQVIESGKQLYLLWASLRGSQTTTRKTPAGLALRHAIIEENITINDDGSLQIDSSLSLLLPEHVSLLLCNYTKLKEDAAEDLTGDLHGILLELEDLVERTFKNSPFMFDLILGKTDGRSNEQIQKMMEAKYGVVHNAQYYSTVWRKRIPKIIAKEAQKQGVYGHYNNEVYGDGKYCNKCGQGKPVNPLFFGKNSTKTGYYSICNDCRSKKQL